MTDNTVFTNDPKISPPPVKIKTRQQILDADPDSLSTEELQRRALFIDIDHKELERELVKRQTEKMKMTDAQNRDKFFSRGQELKKTNKDQERQQAACSHRKGGRGVEALIKGGNAPDYCFLKHLLPWNEWYIRCMRCGKTWKPPHKEDYDNTPESLAAYEKARTEYKWAMECPTDNTPSTGITFQWDDGGEFAHQTVKDTTLR